MTTTTFAPMSPSAAAVTRRHGRRLAGAGCLAGSVAGAVCLVVVGVLGGPGPLPAAIAALVLTLGFYGLGQLVVMRFATGDPRMLMGAALASYGARSGLLLLALGAWSTATDVPWADRLAVVSTISVAVVAWLVGEFWAFRGLRIPTFDPADDQPGATR